MAPIERQHGSTLTDGKCQGLRIFDPPVAPPRILDGEHVVAKPAQFPDDQVIEILIAIQPGHSSGVLVLADGRVDLLEVLKVI